MTKVSGRAVAVQPPRAVWLAGGVTVAVSLALLLAAHPGHAAPPVSDADAIGSWSDGATPMIFVVQPGPGPGAIRVVVPALAAGLKAPETLVLKRTGPGVFASPKTAEGSAKFMVSDRRHAEFRMLRDNKQGFGIVDILLAKQ
jgi:hypothetical protein